MIQVLRTIAQAEAVSPLRTTDSPGSFVPSPSSGVWLSDYARRAWIVLYGAPS